MITVTKPYLPSRKKFDQYVDGIFEREWLTNNGPLVQELTRRLEEYLGVKNLLLISNGTLALQIAYRALGVNELVHGKPAEAITTPFTFVATSSSLKWEGIEPIFADIDADSWCINPNNIEALITPQTKAIVPVHVFGNSCDVKAIEKIAKANDIKVIYDAAHAFGVKYENQSLLRWGDASTLSFHATKIFHAVEGGAIIFKRREDLEKARDLINFGLNSPETIGDVGINAKMSEFQAAMGLCVLDDIQSIFKRRKKQWLSYKDELTFPIKTQKVSQNINYNYSYFPIELNLESQLVSLVKYLNENKIYPRRYFFPSLDSLKYIKPSRSCPISMSLSKRILCLPLFHTLGDDEIKRISKLINQYLSSIFK